MRYDRSTLTIVLLGFATTVLFSCTRTKITTPPITPAPTGEHHSGMFVWYDLLTHDLAATKRFYGELFGWRFEDTGRSGDELYTVVTFQGVPIAGVVYTPLLEREVNRSRWVSYMSVPDVDQAVDISLAHGGTVLRKPGDLEHRGRFAVIQDPQGAIIAFIRANGGDPPDRDPLKDAFVPGEWLWTELWTHGVGAAVEFYERLVGYQHDEIDTENGDKYYVMKYGDRLRAGMLELPWDEVEPNWLPYVLVNDVHATISRLEELGGDVLVAPEGEEGRQMAIFTDPSGAAMSVQELPARER